MNDEISSDKSQRKQWRILWTLILITAGIIAAMILFITTPLKNYVGLEEVLNFGFNKQEEVDPNGQLPDNGEEKKPQYFNPLSGEPVETLAEATRRPLAIMVASDVDTRPQSGLSEAEWVFEMPAGRGVMTRLMPVYIEKDPKELGSLRSSRHDFVEIAKGLDALYAHWGGSYLAYNKYLTAGFVDNLDVMRYPDANGFYRVNRLYAPHNGFADPKELRKIAKEKGYKTTTDLKSYRFFAEDDYPVDRPTEGELFVGQPGNFAVTYKYNGKSNSYSRYYGSQPHIDYNTNKTIEVENVIIMRTTWYLPRQDQQYVEIDLEGEGAADFYRNGQRTQGVWKKATPSSELRFYYGPKKDKEVPLMPGQTWVHVIATNIPVAWTTPEIENQPL
ncbi:DUF3048 domain-containing protein [Patescibacteria group bacterium]